MEHGSCVRLYGQYAKRDHDLFLEQRHLRCVSDEMTRDRGFLTVADMC